MSCWTLASSSILPPPQAASLPKPERGLGGNVHFTCGELRALDSQSRQGGDGGGGGGDVSLLRRAEK